MSIFKGPRGLAGVERFQMVNGRGRGLRPHGTIVLVQPSRFRAHSGRRLADAEAWLYDLKHAHRMQTLPAALHAFPVMHEVMEIMSTIANNLADFAAYHRRLDAQRIEQALALAAEEERQAKEEALRDKEEALRAQAAERQAKEEALRVKEEALRAQATERQAKEEERQAKEEALRAQAEANARADALERELAELRAKQARG